MTDQRFPEGIRIVEDVSGLPGVETLEGRIGPLLSGDACRTHYIEMPPGMYCEEHPHSSESLIYTVHGRWVLASGGQRFVMQAGGIFWFKAGAPTGYEVPFDESALILIFKGDLECSDDELVEYLRRLAAELAERHKSGEPFLISELPEDHPCRTFAREIGAPIV